jgi:hypothetical protein
VSLFKRADHLLHPLPGTPVLPPQDLWAALLAVNRPGLPYVVRDGRPDGADLIAEFTDVGRETSSVWGRCRECEEVQILMRFDPPHREVRSIDHLATYLLTLSPPRRRHNTGRSSGQLYTNHGTWQRISDAEGRRRWTRTGHFDSGEARHSLQKVVLSAGWSWHALRKHPL